MHIHREKGLVFLLHPKTASRAIRKVLETRGFEIVGSHHDALRYENCSKLIRDEWPDWSEYEYACVVRNHFDALLTWFWNSRYWENAGYIVNLQFVKEWSEKGLLWEFIWDYPDITILKYENLRRNLNNYLVSHGLDPLDDSEFGVDHEHLTKDKPRGPVGLYWEKNAIKYVRQFYHEEIKRLKYGLGRVNISDYNIITNENKLEFGKRRIMCSRCENIHNISYQYKNSNIVCTVCGYNCKDSRQYWVVKKGNSILAAHGFKILA